MMDHYSVPCLLPFMLRDKIRGITIILFSLCITWAAYSAEYYVATHGQDSNPGTSEAPFATIERAIQAVQERFQNAPNQDCTIWLDGGVYRIIEPLHLTSPALYTQASITFAARPGTRPIISGGIPIENWKQISE